jgi:hypothetical protein
MHIYHFIIERVSAPCEEYAIILRLEYFEVKMGQQICSPPSSAAYERGNSYCCSVLKGTLETGNQ